MPTVEPSSSIYTMDQLTHELVPPHIDKVGTESQYHSVDQHAPMTTASPRISSTPPSTPGLDSNQGKEMKEQGEDDDLLETGNDDYDYNGCNDYDEYVDDEYSEPEEDYFFKDFAETDINGDNDNNGNMTATRRPKSKQYSRRHRSQKAMSRFDLQSFARQLHANRLSVLQSRQSRMILTEEDEKELEKLLARKHSLDDTPPPVPTLPPAKDNTSITLPSPETTETTMPNTIESTQLQTDDIDKDKDTIVVDNDHTSSELAGPIPRHSISFDSNKKNSILLQKLNDQHLSINTSDNASLYQVMAPLSPSISDPSSLSSPRQLESVSPSESLSSSSSSRSSTTSKDDIKNDKITPTSLASTPTPILAVKKKPSWIANHLKHVPSKTKHQLKDTTTSPKPPRRSMSVDTLRDRTHQNEHWKPTITSTTKDDTTTSSSTLSSKSQIPSVDQNKKPKLGLFGSLRQASRSSRASGEGGFRGLMRNLSTVGQRQQQQQQQPSLDQESDHSNNNNNNRYNNTASTMSQAAMAVIHHDASVKKEKLANKAAAATASTTATPELSTKIEVDFMDGVDDTTEQVTHTATSTTGGVRLLTNLLAKARSARRSQKKTPPSSTTATKQNQQQQQQQQQSDSNDDRTPKERNKVVRRTIIYVQPDALDFMKDGHLPPIPAPKVRPLKKKDSDNDDDDDDQDIRFSHDTMMDDASTATTTVEYATATKLTRQTSRRKRLVEHPMTNTPPPPPIRSQRNGNNNNKKWYLESMSQLDIDKPSDNNNNNNDDDNADGQLEGLELREMSDGSVVWGIVKKQGNRKSFFAPKAMDHISNNGTNQEEQDESAQQNDDIEKSVLALMGLGPDSLDYFSQQQQQQQQQQTRARKIKKAPPPIPKRSPRRLTDDPQQQHPGDVSSSRLQRGLSVEEQLDEMMLSIKQAQF